jgi:hypothetical protein
MTESFDSRGNRESAGGTLLEGLNFALLHSGFWRSRQQTRSCLVQRGRAGSSRLFFLPLQQVQHELQQMALFKRLFPPQRNRGFFNVTGFLELTLERCADERAQRKPVSQ